MSLSSDIKEFAFSLGYDRVGFTTADRFSTYEKDLMERRQMYDWAIDGRMQMLNSANPQNILPGARSIIVAIFDYSKQSYPREMIGKVARVYSCYGGMPPHPINRARYRLLKEFVERQGCKVGGQTGRPPARLTEPPVRLAAARAGVANFGRNCCVFAKGIGSFFIALTLVVDAELEYDNPTVEIGCPEDCTLCLDSCPTGALYNTLKLDPHRCLCFNTYATPYAVPELAFFGKGQEVIPLAIREHMNTWVYGCDLCQEVCPRNKERLEAKLPINAYLEQIADDFRLERLVNITDESFNRISSLLHYIKEKRYFQRNAAVALGNAGGEEAITALKQAMQDSDELVRGHAAWALGKIGGSKARRILEQSLARETSEYARGEIAGALAR